MPEARTTKRFNMALCANKCFVKINARARCPNSIPLRSVSLPTIPFSSLSPPFRFRNNVQLCRGVTEVPLGPPGPAIARLYCAMPEPQCQDARNTVALSLQLAGLILDDQTVINALCDGRLFPVKDLPTWHMSILNLSKSKRILYVALFVDDE